MSTLSPEELFARLGDPARMRTIARFDVFEPALRDRLDTVAARTADRLRAPVSMVSVLLDSSQLILGHHGVPGWVAEVRGVPAEWALCTGTVLAGSPYCITDSATDPVHADSPMVAMTGIRSYAGVPLIDDGQSIGALCVIDVAPRLYTDADIAVLTGNAAEAMRILGEYRSA